MEGIIIKNGYVVDPKQNLSQVQDIFIKNGYIVTEEDMDGVRVRALDATGMLVTPGLIDFHAHVYSGVTEIGLTPDIDFIPQGVTTVVDPGSAGVANIQTFIADVIMRNKIDVLGFINVCPTGLGTMKFHENVDPKYWDEDQIREVKEKWPNLIKGLKIRISRDIVGDLGIKPLQEAVALGNRLEMPLAVHVTDAPVPQNQVVECLRKGDIYVHCFQGKGNTIINEEGNVFSAIVEGQKRGVIMDASNGGNHWSVKVATTALRQGFIPDIISTDLTIKTIYKDPVFSLPYIMSKYLSLGVPLETVIKCCTENPATALGLSETIGSLKKGMRANVTLLRQIDKNVIYSDTDGEKIHGQVLLVPEATILDGKVAYRNLTSL